jgi:uncharacterized protein YecE (DUF72 family)
VDFGRLSSLQGISFALPPLPERSRRALGGRPCSEGSDEWLRAGAPVWARKDWLGRLYPKGTADKDLLRTYAQRLGAIELNASYYRVPSEEVLDAWAADVPEAFHFCPKLHKTITHRRDLGAAAPDARGFAERLLRLGPRLGPALLQLPPWLGLEALPDLDELLAALPAQFPVAVEFRHRSWFARNALRDPALSVLERRSASAVITDVAGRRDVCHASITAPFAFIRFVGNGLDPTDNPRTDAWLDRLLEWRELGLTRAYFFAHQPDDAVAPETLQHFVTAARRRGVRMPAVTLEPEQLDLFGLARAP